ncbi:hypothetical protein H2199_009238 [Coniosporium tulheliwenetii]|uniref:Uncharacterized protein n=1 Tax=Coniosporium tulheliwenetii TaxID=3383036 RepID=A0ACC2YEX7_9PEZI|nr:hypothetical protein H2199_009238 [Cladosporium sp. JES 115]
MPPSSTALPSYDGSPPEPSTTTSVSAPPETKSRKTWRDYINWDSTESEPQKSPKAVNRDVLNRSNGNGALGPKNAQFKQWVNDYMETIECLGPGDYIAIKCSGGGTQALGFMTEFTKLCRQNSSEEAEKELRAEMSYMKEQLHKICSTAKSKGIRVLLDAEGSLYQSAVDFAALELMATYNKDSRAYVFNTYQMYLRSSMHKLKSHLDYASKNNYIAGAKLVRGAYLHVEADKTMFQPSKAATDAAFDGAVEYLLQPASSDSKSEEQSGDISWTAEVMLATHNSRSVHKALELWSNTGGDKSRTKSLTFGQLMGMADEVSLSVSAEIGRLQPQQQQHSAGKRDQQDFPQLGVYKYTIWGPFKDCFLYMLRRAEENKDAVARSKESVMAILTELKARLLRSG